MDDLRVYSIWPARHKSSDVCFKKRAMPSAVSFPANHFRKPRGLVGDSVVSTFHESYRSQAEISQVVGSTQQTIDKLSYIPTVPDGQMPKPQRGYSHKSHRSPNQPKASNPVNSSFILA